MEINFSNVGYIYNKDTSFNNIVLDGINFNLSQGKIYSIIGKNGSGKTTILELIDGLMMPTGGHIDIDNFRFEDKSKIKNINDLRIKIGFVFQLPEQQFFGNTVRDEIKFSLDCFKYNQSQIDKRISDSLLMVGLDDSCLDRDPLTLSHGEMRSVAIASILAFNPQVIIFDEPTIGLDANNKKNLIRLIKMLKTRYHKTIIIVSHDTDMLLKISDEVLLLENGKIVLQGNKYEVFSNEKILKRNNIKVPDIIRFSNIVKNKKGIRIGYRDEINDLIKDIYRYVK